jgi:hypothetical protein
MIASFVVLAADRLGTLALTTTHRIVPLAQPLDLTHHLIAAPEEAVWQCHARPYARGDHVTRLQVIRSRDRHCETT